MDEDSVVATTSRHAQDIVKAAIEIVKLLEPLPAWTHTTILRGLLQAYEEDENPTPKAPAS